jgi:hypothetical protein
MPKPEQPLPTSSPSREAIAQLEVGRTDVSPATIRVLLAGFLAVIVSAPLIEMAGARAARSGGAAERAPQFLETDTHWRPEAMEAVAERLARIIEAEVELAELVDPAPT